MDTLTHTLRRFYKNKRIGTRLLFIFYLFYFPFSAKASEAILINIHLFQAGWAGEPNGLKQATILTTSSHPELSALKEKSAAADTELTAATIDALLNIYGLNSLDDLFLHQKWWDGNRLYDVQWDGNTRPGKRPPPFPFDLIIGPSSGYGIKLVPKLLPSQKIALRVVVYRTKKGAASVVDMKSISEQDLVLGIADPVIVEWPCEGGSYFMTVMLTVGDPAKRKIEPKKAQESKQVRLVATPKVLARVEPSYPEELRNRLVGGEIGLRITIDERGIVRRVDVEKPIHPYLNYAAVLAFRQWTFEPLVLDGKPVPVAFRYSYNFYPRSFVPDKTDRATAPGRLNSISQEELPAVLAGSGGYCQKLANSVLNFICEETIKETHYDLFKNMGWMGIWAGPKSKMVGKERFIEIGPDSKPSVFMEFFGASESDSEKIRDTGQNIMQKVASIQIMDPKRTMKNIFLCDYLIVKKAGIIEERRIILKENGKKSLDRSKLLSEKRFSGLSALFAPFRVLSSEQQSRFDFRIIGEERIHGKDVYVIEATPKPEHEDAIWTAKFWIVKKSFQTLKSEIEGVPIDAYEEVLDDCVQLNIKPIFVATHEYQVEKDGILYPSRSKVHVAYPIIESHPPVEKISIQFALDKYKYFSVESVPRIVK